MDCTYIPLNVMNQILGCLGLYICIGVAGIIFMPRLAQSFGVRPGVAIVMYALLLVVVYLYLHFFAVANPTPADFSQCARIDYPFGQ